jgi:hydrogenase maturation protein HypF
MRPVVKLRILISGAVQGVGFRPFVYGLANEFALSGWVLNGTGGVRIEVEGKKAVLAHFLRQLSRRKPEIAHINRIDSSWDEAEGFNRFFIRKSDSDGTKKAFILPDIAVCEACITEIFNPAEDRRFAYPFTNCTNCGPRFSIIKDLPYDRPFTSMDPFTMCESCKSEYENPHDRRFHAQPNACSECGPQYSLCSCNGDMLAQGQQAFEHAKDVVTSGGILAMKGIGGFHLIVDAQNSKAVDNLRIRKKRLEKSLALMVKDPHQASEICDLSDMEMRLLKSKERPIVIAKRKAGIPIALNVAPNNPYLGIMLPYSPAHYLLLNLIDRPIVATSGNVTDEPICIENIEALERLGHLADAFFMHNRAIVRHVDDSVCAVAKGHNQLLRRSRGFSPMPVGVQDRLPPILAVGGQLKNTVALSIDQSVFISQHIGDLESEKTLIAFEKAIYDFLRLYEINPVAIVHDFHPDYSSTLWAIRQVQDESSPLYECPLMPIQHHHAHLAACLAENGCNDEVLGIVWDGTGYGLDGTIWGGEFFVGTLPDFKRRGCLAPFMLPGGNRAIKEPKRCAISLLWQSQLLKNATAPAVTDTPKREVDIILSMLDKKVNCPVTSSMGRLFDAVSSLLGLHHTVTFEGQAAMALEYAADTDFHGTYNFSFAPTSDGSFFQIDWHPLVRDILKDLAKKTPKKIISARFHDTLVDMICEVASRENKSIVALTGGCFQNRRLAEQAIDKLEKQGHKVLFHNKVPPNDGGISLGQIMMASKKYTLPESIQRKGEDYVFSHSRQN